MVKDKKANSNQKDRNAIIPSDPKSSSSQRSNQKTPNGTYKLTEIKEPYWQKTLRRWLIVLFTGMLTWYTAKLFHLTTWQAKDASQKADIAIALSDSIAKNQNKFSRLDSRAWVAFEKVDTIRVRTGEDIKAQISLTNSGHTPANHAKYLIKIYLTKNITTHKIDSIFKNISNEINLSKDEGTLFPGGKTIMPCKCGLPTPLTENQRLGIMSGEYVIYILGQFIYKDVFGGNGTTKFCIKHIPPNLFMIVTKYNIME
jgi:hypothetical protein